MKTIKNIVTIKILGRNLIILCVILASCFISACKNFLHIDSPITSIEQRVVFNSNEQATSAVVGIYAGMNAAGFASGSNSSITFYGGLSCDELIGYGAVLPFYENQLTPTFISNSNLYKNLYSNIYRVNSTIEGLEASNGVTPPVKAQLLGEALFVRAFTYFYLVNLYGPAPLQLSSDYRITSVASNSTTNEIYQQILTDLKNAEELLQDAYPTTGRVRPNKSVVQAMLARTYLYLKDWANAEKYASLVLTKINTYSLVSMDAIFLANSQETIWQLMPAAGVNAPDPALFIPSSTTVVPTVVSLRGDFVSTAFEVGDRRLTSWVRSFNVASITYYYPFKYKVRTATTATEYSTIFRLAEQYLIRAEARINLDKINEGIADLNTVRQRVLSTGISNPIPAISPSLSKINALLAVEKERRVELFSEWGHRWLDLKRTGRADAILTPIKTDWQTTDVLYPIPADEVDRNRNIKQNEGY